MRDSFGRNIDYIRISVTDRCNFRCLYCMPEKGVDLLKHEEIMTFDEILRLCRILSKNGIKKVKITGGEPLVRLDICDLIRQIKAIEGIEQVTITTNGALLSDYLEDLVKAGIDGINISLDTLDKKEFARLTRRDEFDKVWQAIQKTLEYPQINLKINCVPLKLDDQNILDLVNLAKDNKLHVRFIEMMPIGLGKNLSYLSEESIKEIIEKSYGKLKTYEKKLGNGPSHYYELEGFKGKIGFISAISHKFCDQCNRVRITANGFLKTCLQYNVGVDLLALMRADFDDEKLEKAIVEAVDRKPMEHSFLDKNINNEEDHVMAQIGG